MDTKFLLKSAIWREASTSVTDKTNEVNTHGSTTWQTTWSRTILKKQLWLTIVFSGWFWSLLTATTRRSTVLTNVTLKKSGRTLSLKIQLFYLKLCWTTLLKSTKISGLKLWSFRGWSASTTWLREVRSLRSLMMLWFNGFVLSTAPWQTKNTMLFTESEERSS